MLVVVLFAVVAASVFAEDSLPGSLASVIAALAGNETVERAGDKALDMAVDVGAPPLASWIAASREEALAEGVEPVPAAVRTDLAGFFPSSLLDQVRFRIGWGSARSLQGHVFRFHRTKAITLGDLIVFRDEDVAADPLIWAHELAHVRQYQRWGIAAFAEKYVRDFGSVEGEAWRVHGRYKSWAQRHGLIPDTDPDTMWERD